MRTSRSARASGIARRHQVSRRRFLDHLRHAADRGAHRRPSRRHRLQQRIREALHGVGTQDEHVYCPEEIRDIRAGPRQHHAVVEIEFADEPFDLGSHRAVTDDQELRIGHTVDHQACGPKKRGVVLLRPQHRDDPDDLVGFADTEIGHRAAVIGPLETIGINAVGDDVDLGRRILQVVDQVIDLRPRQPEIGAGHPVQHAICNSANRAPWLDVAVVVNPDNVVRHACQPSRDAAEHLGAVTARDHHIGREVPHLARQIAQCADRLPFTAMQCDRPSAGRREIAEQFPLHCRCTPQRCRNRERSRFGISFVTCRSAPPMPRSGTTYITRMGFERITGRPPKAGRTCARRRLCRTRLLASTRSQT